MGMRWQPGRAWGMCPFLSLMEVSGCEGLQAHQAPLGPSFNLQLTNDIWFLFNLSSVEASSPPCPAAIKHVQFVSQIWI